MLPEPTRSTPAYIDPEGTPLDQYGQPAIQADAPVMPYISDEPMPGSTPAVTREGRVLYVSHAPVPQQYAPTPERQQLPGWAKGASLVLLATGGTAVLGAVALAIVGSAAGGLTAAADALTTICALVAQFALFLLVLLGAIVLAWKHLKPAAATATGQPRQTAQPQQITNITNNVTVHARGFAARGSATGIKRIDG
jgi:hypothetical protein